jgi:hypothetical protein
LPASSVASRSAAMFCGNNAATVAPLAGDPRGKKRRWSARCPSLPRVRWI